MPISFTCPHCGNQSSVGDQYAGQSGPCKFCGQIITIPKPRLSLLAVSSAVLSCVCVLGCFTGLPGMLLGLFALHAINRSQGALSGLKLAKAGVWIGGIVTTLHLGTVVAVMFVSMMQAARDASSPVSQQPGLVVEQPDVVVEQSDVAPEEPDPASEAQRTIDDRIQDWMRKTERVGELLDQLYHEQAELEGDIASAGSSTRDSLRREQVELKGQIRALEGHKSQCELNVELMQSKVRRLRRQGWLQEAMASDAEWDQLVRLALELDEQLSDASGNVDVNNVLESLGSTPSERTD